MRPLVGITTDLITTSPDGPLKAAAALAYARCVAACAGTPLLLPPILDLADEHLARCDALVLTGGDDPRTEPFGVPTHPKATPVHPDRQAYEMRLLSVLRAERPDLPVLGVCLGMQMMALSAGGRLDQHMPDTRPGAARHWKADHPIVTEPGRSLVPGGVVHSHHRQAVEDPGCLRVEARADDGVIEALADPSRRFYLGVQWHPERTASDPLGAALFQQLIAAARGS